MLVVKINILSGGIIDFTSNESMNDLYINEAIARGHESDRFNRFEIISENISVNKNHQFSIHYKPSGIDSDDLKYYEIVSAITAFENNIPLHIVLKKF